MEVGGTLASLLLGAFSLPCLLLLLVLGEAGLRVAALTLRRGEGQGPHHAGWPTRSAFLGYRIARAGGSSSSSSSSSVFHYDDEPPPLPPECCDRLALAVYRLGDDRQGPDDCCCAFCLSAVRDGDETRDLRCRHVFHRACIDAWLVRPRATCPLCRDRLLPADDDDPPRSATADDDDLVYGYVRGGYDADRGGDALSSSSSASAAVDAGRGGALWHVT